MRVFQLGLEINLGSSSHTGSGLHLSNTFEQWIQGFQGFIYCFKFRATASTPPCLLNNSSTPLFHKTNTKSLTLFSKHKNPFLSLAFSSFPNPHFFTFRKLLSFPNPVALKPIFKVGASSTSSSEETSDDDDATQEVFDWPSVLLDSIHASASTEDIQKDLSPLVKQLEPGKNESGALIPFMAVGNGFKKEMLFTRYL
ncbi:uncharacterized protein LOC141713506 [Apium graveolens]|uniref:uncharacterized protein LOC141713506 n=1 Tax=Apium graveolens TaxID=4045 RepID=UPI003D7A93B8